MMTGTRYTATAGTGVVIPARAHHAWHTHAAADAALLARWLRYLNTSLIGWPA